MAIEITVPRLGWNMEEGVFLAWLKQDGDTIKAGDALFTLEGDKAVQDVEATDGGTLHIDPHGPKVGDTVKVGTILGWMAEANESVPPAMSEQQQAIRTEESTPSPVAVAPVIERVMNKRHDPAVSPRARRAARELGIDPARLQGSGRTGRVRERDVRVAAPAPPGQPVTPTRRAIAAHMLASLRSTAPVTLTTTVDAGNLVNLRKQFKAATADGTVPSFTDFIIKLTASALKMHPALNSRWERESIVVSEGIHIGLAVDTEAGLVVPVIRDVPTLGLRQLVTASRDFIERAKSRKLTASEMQGGTFTVTNLGQFGIDAFTPIINYPECAILGVGRIHRQPAVKGEQIVAREQVTLSLTFDHRIVDGAPAARFLDMVRKCIENPGPWLMT